MRELRTRWARRRQMAYGGWLSGSSTDAACNALVWYAEIHVKRVCVCGAICVEVCT